jgi:hypothetical protein
MKVYFAIGNAQDAERAARGQLAELGSGAFRTAFVDEAEKTVYKVPGGWHNADTSYQTTEYCNARTMLADNVRGVPPVELYVVTDEIGRTVPIIAMPYFPRHSRTASYAERDAYWERETSWSGYVDDIHGENWRLNRRGKPVVTDMGSTGDAGWDSDGETPPFDS